jgi:hypothetical protein
MRHSEKLNKVAPAGAGFVAQTRFLGLRLLSVRPASSFFRSRRPAQNAGLRSGLPYEFRRRISSDLTLSLNPNRESQKCNQPHNSQSRSRLTSGSRPPDIREWRFRKINRFITINATRILNKSSAKPSKRPSGRVATSLLSGCGSWLEAVFVSRGID